MARHRRVCACLLPLATVLWVITAYQDALGMTPPGSSSAISSTKPVVVRFGVLATRGPDEARQAWQPTADYLASQVPGHVFEIVPLNPDGIKQAVGRGELDMFTTNPANYVEIEALYGATRIATRKAVVNGIVCKNYAGLIFCRAARRDINTLGDLKGTSFAAWEENSFSGWWMAWREFKRAGIDPYKDLASLVFVGGSQDSIVYAVRDGKAVAGAVRSDQLEAMAAEGKITLSDFRILNEQPQTPDFPFPRSTAIYPEWPMATVSIAMNEDGPSGSKQTVQKMPEGLSEEIAVALLRMPPNSPAAVASRCAGWTVPLAYTPVHECMKELHLGPYADYGEATPAQVARRFWYWLVAAGAALLFMGAMIVHLLRKSRTSFLVPHLPMPLPSPRLVSAMKRFSFGAGAALMVVGCLVLVGWMLGIRILTSVVPGFKQMNPASAAAFILGGLSLACLQTERPGWWPGRVGRICAVGVLLTGLLCLCRYFGLDLGVDQVLFHDKVWANRMSPNTALSFVLLGLSLILVDKDSRRIPRPSEWLALTAFMIALLAVVGYAYGVRLYYGIAAYIPMAVHSALAFVIFSLAVLCARPNRGIVAIITSDTAGATMARNLLPAAIAVPIALGWLRLLGQQAGLYETEVGVSLQALAGMVVFVVLVGWNAQTLHKIDMQRRRAEELLHKAHEELERRVEERTAELYTATELLRLDQSRSEALLKLHQMAGAAISQITDFTLEEAVRLAQSTIGYLAFLNEDETVLTMHSWSKSAMQECQIVDKPIVYPVVTTGLWGEAVRQRKAVITNDYAAPNPLKKGCPQGHVKVLRHMSVPVFDGGKIVIVAGVGNKAGPYDESDVQQLTLLMQGMWLLIQRKRAEMELDQHRLHLEVLVADRTQELAKTNDDLQREVAERKRAEEGVVKLNADLRRWTTELEAANKELEAFTYSASHDLRAPLRSMDGFSQALLEDYGDRLDDQGRDYLRRVRAGAQRMGQLIDDLLGLSRIGRAEMQHDQVNLSDMAGSVIEEIRQAAPQRQAQWVVAPGMVVTGDARLLRIMLENLLGNAWKFTGKRSEAHIELGIADQNGQNVYYVKDDGAGFDMAYANKLFTPFQRLHDAEEFPGTGIGLALVQRIIHRHGGRVWAEGKVNQGATFYFSL